MIKRTGVLPAAIAASFICSLPIPPSYGAEIVGQRPYEMEWAGRTQDIYPPLVDFENLSGWKVVEKNATATFERSREQQLWGSFVGKLTYRTNAKGTSELRLLPPAPIRLAQPWDAFSCWVYGNSIGGDTPRVTIAAIFLDAKGAEVSVPLTTINWKEWFVPYQVLADTQRQRLADGALFNGFWISGVANLEDRVLYFDNFATFQEKLRPLQVSARPQRGIAMLPGQDTGFNTGAGKLPFPNREQTILPDNATSKFTTRIRQDGSTLFFEYRGEDGNLTYRLQPQNGNWSDISAQWNDGAWFNPLVGGGAILSVNGQTVAPEKATHQSTQVQGESVISTWTLFAGGVSQDVTYTYRLQNKSLVIDTISKGGKVAEVRYGHAEKTEKPRLVWNPFYTYNTLEDRPGVVVMGDAANPLFLTGNTDWYLSNASTVWGKRNIDKGQVAFNGGTRYLAKTDGTRNDVYERFFVTIAPKYEEVLPNIPNPKSPWMKATGTRAWTVRGSSANRKADIDYFTKIHRYGITDLVITDHETMWRDGEESFTFRTKAAPAKGGDKAQAEYARFLQDKLGYLYGPYNNFTDFAPVNEFWTPDLINRTSDGQLQHAWRRSYAPKPALALDFAAKLPPLIEEKFHFSTAYCDVHSAISPWSRTDYDARVPGAGTFAATFYAYGEILQMQKQTWDGPVYSEGGHHWMYAGITDGNYGQDSHAQLYKNPWLVDFNLRKIHALNTNFGMGAPRMYWGRTNIPGDPADMDQFFAATIAFGHTGFLLPLGNDPTLTLRSYYMPLALHSRYALADVKTIRYADAAGNLLDTSHALASRAHTRSQIVTHYDDGTVTAVNGSAENWMRVEVDGRKIALPPYGYTGWSSDGKVHVFSGNQDNYRADYSVSEKYLHVDGRGKFTRFEKAASDGAAVCRILGNGEFEIIPVNNADCGFAIKATSAVALDEAGKEIGPAQTRAARGLTYVIPVAGAFSYRVRGTLQAPQSTLQSTSSRVLPGQKVTVRGATETTLQIPADARPNTHLWLQSGGEWIDFQVTPLTEATLLLDGQKLRLNLQSNLEQAASFSISFEGREEVLPLPAGQSGTIEFDLGAPMERESRFIHINIRANDSQQALQRVLLSEQDYLSLATLPREWKAGMQLRGGDEMPADAKIGGQAAANDALSSGGVVKSGLSMHPPYKDAVGSVFAKYAPLTLPAQPAAFRASIGRRDGSFQGDGILFKVAVVEGDRQTIVAEQTVKDFEWKPIEADLSPWAGKTIQIQLIADPGPADNTEADWAGWAEMRIESKERLWSRRLSDDLERYQREPGPFPATGVSLEELRSATSAKLHYQGLGVSSGTGTRAVGTELNGAKVGFLSGATGNEAEGIWADASIRLPVEAIRSLGKVNSLALDNSFQDYFAIRRFWIELQLVDGRKVSSQISGAAFTQPPTWAHGTGIKVPFSEKIRVDIAF